MKAVLASLLFVSILTGCEASYRYPCQDPANWNNEECKKPACIAIGECSEDLVGKEAWDAANGSSEPVSDHTTEQPCPPSETGVE